MPNWKRIALMERATARFWQYADMSNGPDACWPWRGNSYKDGRARLYIGDGYEVLASRYAYALCYGADPGEMMVCHHCDNPNCVNAAHFFLGTAKDNLIDASQKGRLVGSSSSYTSEQIKMLWATKGGAAFNRQGIQRRPPRRSPLSEEEKRARSREQIKQLWANPEWVARKNEESRARLKALWSDPEYRAQMTKPLCPRGHDKEGRRECRECNREKARLRRERLRAERSETPEQTRARVRAIQSQASKALWADQGKRAQMVAERATRPLRTHCVKGHELNDANVYRRGKRGRICRTCQLASVKAWRASAA